MRKTIFILFIVLCAMSSSCVREPYPDNSNIGNFEALWDLMDTHYCFFDYKADEYGLDWNEVHDRYRPMVTNQMSGDALFEVLCRMLGELRDGHVNLYTSIDVGRYWSWREDFPVNYYEHIRDNYLGTDFRIGGGMRYQILDDNVGYVYYGDFTGSVDDGYWNRIINYMTLCNGMIIDVRDNGGGYIFNVETIMSHFTEKSVLCGYMCHKTGPGHSDFSPFEERWVSPAIDQLRWQKPVAILTNRGCFSATNTFVSDMRALPQVRVFGDRTGGGGGVPLSLEMPNGWSVRYSSAPMTDAQGNHIEFGVEPDVRVDITESDMLRGVDTIIESAREWINSFLR